MTDNEILDELLWCYENQHAVPAYTKPEVVTRMHDFFKSMSEEKTKRLPGDTEVKVCEVDRFNVGVIMPKMVGSLEKRLVYSKGFS